MTTIAGIKYYTTVKNGVTHRLPAERQFYLNYLFQSSFHPRIAVLADKIEALIRERGQSAGFDRLRFYEAAGLCLYAHRGVTRKNDPSKPFADHPITVAEREVEILHVCDSEELIAALLHDTVEDTEVDLAFISRRFGQTVANLVDGVTKIEQLGKDRIISEENINKFVKALRGDIRALRIKMVDRGVNLEDAEKLTPESRERNCSEALDFYVPLGVLCGLMKAARHLSDIALRKLNSERYAEIEQVIQKTIAANQEKLLTIKKQIERIFKGRQKNRFIEVTAKPRTVFEVDQIAAMRRTEAHRLSDVAMMQVVVATEAECYEMVRLIHSLGSPIDRYWHDYIKDPKINHYQSLHTGIIVDGTLIRFQIRTREMQRVAQDGLLSDAYNASGRFKQPPLRWLNDDWLKAILQVGERREKILLTKSLAQAWLATVVVKGPSFSQTFKDVLLPRGVTPREIAFIADPMLGVCLTGANQAGFARPIDTLISDGVGYIELELGNDQQDLDFAELIKNPLARLRFQALQASRAEHERERFARRILGRELVGSFLQIDELAEADPEKVRRMLGQTSLGVLSAAHAAAELGEDIRNGGSEMIAQGRLEVAIMRRTADKVIDEMRRLFWVERYGVAERLQLSIPLWNEAQARQLGRFARHLQGEPGIESVAHSEIRPPLFDEQVLNPHSLFYSLNYALNAALAFAAQRGNIIDLNLDPPLIEMMSANIRSQIDTIVAEHIAKAHLLFLSAHSPEQLDRVRLAIAAMAQRSRPSIPLIVAYLRTGMFQTEGIIKHLADMAHIGISLTDLGHSSDFIIQNLAIRAGVQV
jgi:(p)ppGpp synthase/HD superfamily hydrolase